MARTPLVATIVFDIFQSKIPSRPIFFISIGQIYLITLKDSRWKKNEWIHLIHKWLAMSAIRWQPVSIYVEGRVQRTNDAIWNPTVDIWRSRGVRNGGLHWFNDLWRPTALIIVERRKSAVRECQNHFTGGKKVAERTVQVMTVTEPVQSALFLPWRREWRWTIDGQMKMIGLVQGLVSQNRRIQVRSERSVRPLEPHQSFQRLFQIVGQVVILVATFGHAWCCHDYHSEHI